MEAKTINHPVDNNNSIEEETSEYPLSVHILEMLVDLVTWHNPYLTAVVFVILLFFLTLVYKGYSVIYLTCNILIGFMVYGLIKKLTHKENEILKPKITTSENFLLSLISTQFYNICNWDDTKRSMTVLTALIFLGGAAAICGDSLLLIISVILVFSAPLASYARHQPWTKRILIKFRVLKTRLPGVNKLGRKVDDFVTKTRNILNEGRSSFLRAARGE